MNDDSTEYRHYRNRAQAGFEEWAIGISEDGNVWVREGPSGRTVRLTEQPAGSEAEAQRVCAELIAAKLKAGYEYVGQAVIVKGRLSTRPARPAPGLNWTIMAGIDLAAMLEQLRWITAQLNGGPLNERVSFSEEDHSLRVYAVQTWTLGFSDHGGLRRSDGRGGGKIIKDHGLLPCLILTYLQRHFSGRIQISDAADTIVVPQVTRRDPVLGESCFDYWQVLELGARLHLCLSHTSAMSRSSSDDSSAFCF